MVSISTKINSMKIHQICIGNKDYQESHADWMKSTKSVYQNCEYILWDEQACLNLVEAKYSQLLPIYHSYKYDVNRADAIRYMILYEHGGLYLDLDIISYKSIQPRLTSECVLFECHRDDNSEFHFPKKSKYLTNSVMYCTPGCMFMKRAINNLARESRKFTHLDEGRYVIMSTANGFLTNMYYKFHGCADVTVYDMISFEKYNKQIRREIASGDDTHPVTQEMYGIHLNVGSWISNNDSPHKVLL